jgi:hypothetical protein
LPLGLEVRFDLDVPRALGVIRLSAGPEVALWTATTSGLPRAASTVFAQPGAFVRAAYRLELGRLVLTVGVAVDAVLLRDSLTIGGVGSVARTPVVLVSPFVGLGVGFL